MKKPRVEQLALDRRTTRNIMKAKGQVVLLVGHFCVGGAMIRKRNIGTVAALGGFTAAVAMMTALPSANADELADLRANQELLQRRVDQLAQAGPAAFPPPGAGPGG